MAYFLVRNSLNPHKAILCGITYKQVVPKGGEGEAIWVIEVATEEPHATTSGTIAPYIINLTDQINVGLEIEKAVAHISSQVDWEPLSEDTRPPFVDEISPSSYIVDIYSNVIASIVDLHPSFGIDIDSIEMYVNDIDVSDELRISGDEYNYKVEWRPPSRVFEQI